MSFTQTKTQTKLVASEFGVTQAVHPVGIMDLNQYLEKMNTTTRLILIQVVVGE